MKPNRNIPASGVSEVAVGTLSPGATMESIDLGFGVEVFSMLLTVIRREETMIYATRIRGFIYCWWPYSGPKLVMELSKEGHSNQSDMTKSEQRRNKGEPLPGRV